MIVVSDDVEVMQSLARAGGTIVRWPERDPGEARPGETPADPHARRMIAPERVRAVVDAYVDAYRRNDRQACLDLFAADAEWHDPVGEPPHVGHEGIGMFWDQAHAMADSIVLVPNDVIVCANQAAMVFEIHVSIGRCRRRPDDDDHGRGRDLRARRRGIDHRTSRVLGHVARAYRALSAILHQKSRETALRGARDQADFRSATCFGHNL